MDNDIKKSLLLIGKYGYFSDSSYYAIKNLLKHLIPNVDFSFYASSLLRDLSKIDSYDTKILYVKLCVNYFQIGGGIE